MQPILRHVVDAGARAAGHLIGHLVAAIHRHGMGEDRILRQSHLLRVADPAGVLEGLLDLRLLVELAALIGIGGHPIPGVDDVSAVVALHRVVNDPERPPVGSTIGAGPLVDLRVEVVAVWPGDGHVHPEARGDEQRLLHRAPGPGQGAGGPGEQKVLPLQVA